MTTKEQFLNILRPYQPLDPSAVRRLLADLVLHPENEGGLLAALWELGVPIPARSLVMSGLAEPRG